MMPNVIRFVFRLLVVTIILCVADARPPTKTGSSNVPWYAILIIVLTFVLFIAFLVGVFFLARHISKMDESSKKQNTIIKRQYMFTLNSGDQSEECMDMNDQSALNFSSEKSISGKSTRSAKAMRANKGQEAEVITPQSIFVAAFCERGVKALIQDFTQATKGVDKPDVPTTAFDKNPKKNRYQNIACIDSTRIVLKNRSNDYIHANWIIASPTSQRFIATQAPKKRTIEDFWQMAVQEDAGIIVMLCSFVEDGQTKCAVYFPVKAKQKFEIGDVRVVNSGVISVGIPNTSLRALIVEDTSFFCKRHDKFYIPHVIWNNWPDHSTPENAFELLDLYKNAIAISNGKSIIVHCAAGIGRTGVFCAFHFVIERLKLLEADSNVTTIDLLKELRTQRFNMVQTALQYVFLHVLIIEWLVSERVITQKKSLHRAFIRNYQKYREKVISKQNKESGKNDE